MIEKAVDLFNSTMESNTQEVDLDSYMSKMDGDRIEYLIKNYSKISLMVTKAYSSGKVADNITLLSEDLGKLRFVVDNLKDEDMKIIKMCYFSKTSISKIAQDMHMSTSTIRRHRDNAVKEIKSRMYMKVDRNG